MTTELLQLVVLATILWLVAASLYVWRKYDEKPAAPEPTQESKDEDFI